MSFAFFLFIYIYGGINAFYYFFFIFYIHKKILYRTIYLKINQHRNKIYPQMPT